MPTAKHASLIWCPRRIILGIWIAGSKKNIVILPSVPTSYSGIAYGAAMAWSPTENREMNLAGMLDTLVFKDSAGVMGQLVLDAGNYFEVEGVIPNNITHSFLR